MIFFKLCYFLNGINSHPTSGSPPARPQYPTKQLFFLVILLVFGLKVSARPNPQRIDLNLTSVPLITAFDEIKKQTGYGFWYEKADLEGTKKVTLRIKSASLRETLDKCFLDQPLTYEIFDKTIVVKKKANSKTEDKSATKKDIRVQGKVSDDKGEPLSGVNVSVPVTEEQTTTNKDGLFSVVVPDASSVIRFSYIGYIPLERALGNDSQLLVVLKEALQTLQIVEVNAGYYKVKERERTGSISTVSAATISRQPINNPLMALQGRVPGMEITQLTGVPGGGFRVQIRGRNSINTAVGNDPLYVVDGVPYPSNRISSNTSSAILSTSGASPMSFLNPNDIENIDILKDADATAIYGSRGANGVVLITTRKGQSGAAKFNVSLSQGLNMVGHEIELLNTQQYVEMRQQAVGNAGLLPSARDYDINGSWDMNSYTDWQKELIGGKASTTNAQFNVSGGNDEGRYLIGGNYFSEGTVFPGKFGLERAGMHFSLNIGSPKNRFTGNFVGNYSNTKSNLLRSDLTNLILLPPNAPNPFDQYGQLNWENNTVYTNPMAQLLLTNNAKTGNLIGNLNLNYRLLDQLILKIAVGYTSLQREELARTPLSSRSPALASVAANRIADFSDNSNSSLIAEPQISYRHGFGKGKLDVLLGASLQHNQSHVRTIRGTGFSSDGLMDNIASASTLTIPQNSFAEYRYNSVFTRANFSFHDRYIFNLTARRDGSSRFAYENRFGNFGAIGAAWIFSDEKFVVQHLPFLSFGKLRASYGLTGNDQIPDYGYLQLWSSLGTYQGVGTLSPQRIANPDFGWETNKKAEMATQLGLLDNRITVELAHYINISSNQLVGYPLPLSTGNSTILMNLPAKVKNTGWEFSAEMRIMDRGAMKWIASVNLTIPKNKLLAYPGGIENSPYAINYIIGQPLSIRKIYNVTGINQTTGLYEIEDKNNNGVLDNDDRYLSKFIGQYYFGGLQNTINYRGFALDFLISFNKQNGLSYMNGSSNPGFFDYINPINNQPAFSLNDGNVQRPNSSNAAYVQYLNARENGGESIVDASYLRLKNLSISYDLPQKSLDRLKLSALRISLQGQNIFTWTNYLGLDPESQRFQGLPPLRALSLGLNLSL